jgi:hypothetical protein
MGWVMNKPIFAISLVLVVLSVGRHRQAECQDHQPADRQWIVAIWRSYKLDYADFGEWKGAAQIELVVISPDEIGLFLISADGKRSRAGDSQPSIMDDSKLYFGPIGSSLQFHYRRMGNDVLILDLNKIHAELRREKK